MKTAQVNHVTILRKPKQTWRKEGNRKRERSKEEREEKERGLSLTICNRRK